MSESVPEITPATRAASGEQGVFRRTASGLTREISGIEHWIYNVFTLLVLTGAAFFYVWAPGQFPATNPILGVVVAGVALIPIFMAYSLIASAMPRSGGDYIFQSRVLHPSIGFMAMMAQVIWLWYWLELTGFWIAAMVLSPTFSLLGVYTNSAALLSLGTWFSGSSGILLTALITNIFVALVFLPGLKNYLRWQWFLFAAVVVALLVMTFMLLTTSNAEFIANFNAFMIKFDPAQTNYYQFVIDTANANGFNPTAGGGIYGIIGVVAIAWFNLLCANWSMINLGEIKHANSYSRVNRIQQASVAFGVLVMGGTMALLFHVLGRDFTLALGYTWFNDLIAFPVAPFTSVLVPIMGGGAIVVILILFGFLCQAFQQSLNCLVGGTRLIVAMSMDRLLPDGLGKISRRFRGSPVNAIIFLILGAEVLAFILWFVPNLETYALSTSMTTALYAGLSCLAAALFPYRAKAIYNSSPITKYKLGGLPLITVVGALGFVECLIVIGFYLFEKNLGLASSPGLIGMLAVYVLTFVWFWATRAQNKRKGIDVDLNFKTIPPE